MDELYNFNLGKRNIYKSFGGANGDKISIIYEDEQYMIKFPPKATINKDISYTNSCISEYLGCHIFNMLGIKAQKTYLGKYNNKIVVACEDLTTDGFTICDFASLKNQIIDSERKGYGTELDGILDTITKQEIFDSEELMQYFWDMFVVDAFIGNFDRHNGNWGYLYNDQLKIAKLCPIYDCGSTLLPQADEKIMHQILNDVNELNSRIYNNRPSSSIMIDGKRINYYDYLINTNNENCILSIINIVSKINVYDINGLIDNTPTISNLQKEFYKTFLQARYEKILTPAFEKAIEYEMHKEDISLERKTELCELKQKVLNNNPKIKKEEVIL